MGFWEGLQSKKMRLILAIIVFLVFGPCPTALALSLDESFGDGGVVTGSFGPGRNQAEAVAAQPDGRIIVAGIVAHKGQQSVALIRLLPDGTSDSSFGNNGKVGIHLGRRTFVYGMVLSRGRIFIAGYFQEKHKTDLFIAATDSDGNPDLGFAKNGLLVMDLGGEEQIHYMAIQPDGRLVVAGFIEKRHGIDFLVGRILPNGKPDPSFANKGWWIKDASASDRFFGVTIQDRQILATGSSLNAGGVEACVIYRLEADGRTDKSFGNKGRVEFETEKQDICAAITTDQEGNILATGFVTVGRSTGVGLFRLDPSSHLQERQVINTGPPQDMPHGITVSKDQIFIAGELSNANLQPRMGIMVWRPPLLSVDTLNLPDSSAEAMALSKNHVLLAGRTKNKYVVVRYLIDP